MEGLQAYQLIPRTTPLPGHFTVSLIFFTLLSNFRDYMITLHFTLHISQFLFDGIFRLYF
jgi:hypothetical protein